MNQLKEIESAIVMSYGAYNMAEMLYEQGKITREDYESKTKEVYCELYNMMNKLLGLSVKAGEVKNRIEKEMLNKLK